MSGVSVVIPVKDGARYLGEVLSAVLGEGVDEVLVIDSGSRDGSATVARAAGASVVSIAPGSFGHGRTRNLGVERTSGELVAFLTQDATPTPGWLEAHRAALALDPRVGASYGPHLPRPDTSPMIARELVDFFATFSPDGTPVVQDRSGPSFLSNVNAVYRRECWEEVRFRDLAYAEDQAFGVDLLAAGWLKAYHPDAAVLHAHDYGTLEFMRRYFDEYRGLRASMGHVEPFGVRTGARHVRALVAGDRRWMREQGWNPRQRAAWTARSAVHHSGRKGFSALGSRAERLPAPVQRAISLEGTAAAGRGGAAGTALPGEPRAATPSGDPCPEAPSGGPRREAPSGLPPSRPVRGWRRRWEYEDVASWLREGTAPLAAPVKGMSARSSLHIAMLIPAFRRGSGGHALLFQLLLELERMGHTCTIWHVDPLGIQPEPAAVIRRAIREHFAPVGAPVFKDFGEWFGADVALATGWQTVYQALRLPDCRARVYVVNDHEPEFYATSAEARWAEESYRQGLYCVCGSPWLRDLMRSRYGAPGSVFDYGVDHDAYAPRPVARRPDTVVFYARHVTPRRAVVLGLGALDELRRRRPEVRLVLFGESQPVATTFDHEHVGIASPEQLSWLYSKATVGLSLSMTNFSLIPKEMMACGLPVVELTGASARSILGRDGPIELADFDPFALADAIERLLDDDELRARRSREGAELVASTTWSRGARQLEDGVRAALRAREMDAHAARSGASPASTRR
jgi:O-antigen biosynthesis protein